MKTLHRTILALALTLLLAASMASLASASPARSFAPHPLRPLNECQTTRWALLSSNGWVNGGPGFEVYVQVFRLVDSYSGNYCGYADGVAGVEFFGSGQCLRLYAQVGGDDLLGHWSGWYVNYRDVCGSYPQTFWIGTGAVYSATWCNFQAIAQTDQGGYAYTIFHDLC